MTRLSEDQRKVLAECKTVEDLQSAIDGFLVNAPVEVLARYDHKGLSAVRVKHGPLIKVVVVSNWHGGPLNPHFRDGLEYEIVARFQPTMAGWAYARQFIHDSQVTPGGYRGTS